MGDKLDLDTKNLLQTAKTQLKDGIELSSDYNLPDYIEDIRKLVRYESDSHLHNVFYNGSSLQCEGEVTYNILVICEDESIKNIIYSEDFTLSIPSKDGINDDTYIFCRLANPQVRLTTSRRLNCRSRVNIYSHNEETIDLAPTLSGFNVNSSQIVQKKTSSITAMKMKTHYESNFHASHDIELSSTMPEITNIVYCRVNTLINEIKYIDAKLALRGETRVDILYESGEREYRYINKIMPYSEFIDKLYEDNTPCLCKVNVRDIKVSVQNNSFGEMRVLELDYTYDIEEKFFIEGIYELTKDAYSVLQASKCMMQNLEYTRLCECFTTTIRSDEYRDIPDFEVISPGEVLDCFAEIKGSAIELSNEGDKYIMAAECELRVVFQNTDNTAFHNINYTIPVKFEREVPEQITRLCTDHNIEINSCICSIENEKLHINMEFTLSCMIGSIEEEMRVSGIELLEGAVRERSPITLYYPKESDTLWDIAKRYSCTCDAIRSANAMTDSDISDVKVLMIPKRS